VKLPRVLLVDDHALVRRGVTALLQMDGRYEVAGEADNGEDALEHLLNAQDATFPDVVLLDLTMPRMNGLETMLRIHRQWPRLAVVVLSMHSEVQLVEQVLRAGARGYLLKQGIEAELFEALGTVLRGGRYVTAAIDMARVSILERGESELTSREREVLQLIAEGHTTQAVSEILHISHHTVTRHRANLMQKLNAHNQIELLRAALAKGLIANAGRDLNQMS
jgi:two-component system, NarL family, response regulator NreC